MQSLRAFIQIRVPLWGVDGTVTWEGERGRHRLIFMWTPHPMLYVVLNTYKWLQAWTTDHGCSTLEKSCLFSGLNSISLPSPVLGSVSNSLHIPSQPTQIRSLVQGVGLFPRHSHFGFPSPVLSSTAMFAMLTPCMSSKLLLLRQASDQTHINTPVKRFPVSSPAVAHTLPPSVVAPLILYSKSLSMGLLQHTGFLKHYFLFIP